MTRCVVLGGGGPVGIGWEAGLLVGLQEAGIDPSRADSIVGTSAGSVVGATLASGRDLAEASELVAAAGQLADAESGPGSGPSTADAAMQKLIEAAAEAAADPDSAQAVRTRVGSMALGSKTISEDRWLQMFESLADLEWPESFSCTAVDASDGTYRLWDRTAGVDLLHAVASSCAVPGVFPPVTIGGRRWMDGGVRDMVNADTAAGHGVALVISCTLLEIPEGLDLGPVGPVLAATRRRIAGLEEGGAAVATVVPGAEMLQISGFGLNLMDFSLAADAYEAGVRQGRSEAERLSRLWAP